MPFSTLLRIACEAMNKPDLVVDLSYAQDLACVRGDRILLTHDVPRIGAGFGRLKAVDGNQVTLTAAVELGEDRDHVLRVRLADGTSVLRRIATAGPTRTETIELVADRLAPRIEAGDLFAFGVVDQESRVCRVRAIRPTGDFAATLELVDDATPVYEADRGDVPAFKPNIERPADPFAYPPKALAGSPFVETVDGVLQAGVNLSWTPPPASGVVAYLYQYRSESGEWSKVHRVSGPKATVQSVLPGRFEFRVKAEFADAISRWSVPFLVDVGEPNRGPPDVSVELANIQDDIKDVFDAVRNELDDIGRNVDLLGAAAGATDAEQALQTAAVRAETDRTRALIFQEREVRADEDAALARTLDGVAAETEAAKALVTNERKARAEEARALAQTIEAVKAASSESLAKGLMKIEASAAGGDANAAITFFVRASTNESFKEAGLRLEVFTEGGVIRSRTVLRSDQFVMTDGNRKHLPFTFENGQAKLQVANIGRVTSGFVDSENGLMTIDLTNGRIVVRDRS